MSKKYKQFIIASSIYSFAVGAFTPFWLLFLTKNGTEQFAYSVGTMGITTSFASYFAGKYSDRIGRLPILILTWISMALFISLYPSATSWQIYLLQGINGILIAIHMTAETALLGDLTQKETRGVHIGTYHSITGTAAAIAILLGGYLSNFIPISTFFYFTSGFLLIAAYKVNTVRKAV